MAPYVKKRFFKKRYCFLTELIETKILYINPGPPIVNGRLDYIFWVSCQNLFIQVLYLPDRFCNTYPIVNNLFLLGGNINFYFNHRIDRSMFDRIAA